MIHTLFMKYFPFRFLWNAIIACMALPDLWQYSSNYKISTDVYEGPLDLLLQLIEQAELDITKLSLAKVTQQYLTHLQTLADRDPVEVSAFLVIATRLVLIKSSILLPSYQEIQVEEDVGDQLVKQLTIYKLFKEKSLWLRERQELGLKSYYRVAPPRKISEKLDMSNIHIYDLVDILLELFFQTENVSSMSEVVSITALTLKTRIKSLIEIFNQKPTLNFKELLPKNFTRLDLVVTFLALLELIKNHALIADQTDLYSDISFSRTEELGGEFEIEL